MPPIKYKYNSLIFIMQLIRRLMSFLYSNLSKIAVFFISFFAFQTMVFAGNLASLEVIGYENSLEPTFSPTTYTYSIDIPAGEIDLYFNYTKENSGDNVQIIGNEYIKNNTGNITINVSGTTYTITYTKHELINQDFSYKGDVYDFTLPSSGYYKFEVWGAQGGGTIGGKGGYSKGYYKIDHSTPIYVYVGGKGTTIVGRSQTVYGGWNGGGGAYVDGTGSKNTYVSGGGGGATDIALVRSDVTYTNYRYVRTTESYNSRLIVAGGGGGGWQYPSSNDPGGVGGGLTGGAGYYGTTRQGTGTAGSQTSGGSYSFSNTNSRGTFGLGGNDGTTSSAKCGASGGGGGWYGGAGGNTCNADPGYTGGGGSSYLGGVISYQGDSAVTKKGDEAMPTHTGAGTMTGNEGNGFAKITQMFISKDNYLSSLISTKGTFNKTFDPLETEYTLTLGLYDTEYELMGTLSSDLATSVGFGEYEFYEDTGEVSIAVTSESGDTKTYIIHLAREPLVGHSSKLKNIILDGGNTYLGKFNPLKSNYEIDLMDSAIYFSIDYVKYDPAATVVISGNENLINDAGTATITVSAPGVEDTVYEIRYLKISFDVEYPFDYTGEVQEFVIPRDGYYKLEVWGAQGGGPNSLGGKGGYSVGVYKGTRGEKLYIYVGGTGDTTYSYNATVKGGWNGGGGGYVDSSGAYVYYAGGGGGATDIALVKSPVTYSNYRYTRTNDSYNSRLIVAGGGGGGLYWPNQNHLAHLKGGVGGGLNGGAGYFGTTLQPASTGGSQTTGGKYSFAPSDNNKGQFGYGGNDGTKEKVGVTCAVSGGGGGWYGGAGGFACDNDPNYSGGGGSGYVGGVIDSPFTKYDITASTFTGAQSVPTHDGTSTMTGNAGNGYAKITLLSLSNNNYLKQLKTDKGELTPNFDMLTHDYYVTIDSEDYEIKVEARPSSDVATIDGLGNYDIPANIHNIPVGPTDIPITVTAENGDVRVYTIHVTRQASSNGLPKNITISGLVPSYCEMDERFCSTTPEEFDPAITDYDLIVPYKIKEIFFNVEKGHPYQSVNGEGAVTVKPNNNLFTVTVTSEDDTKYTIYNYHVLRDMTGDADLEILNILYPAVSLEDEFDPDITDYYFSVQNSIDKYVINPTNEYNSSLENTVQLYYEIDDKEATSYVFGDGTLKIGLNQISIMVVAKNGDTKTYTLNIYREPDSNVYLDYIKVKKLSEEVYYELNPEYNKIFPGTYKVVVPKEIDKVELLAQAESGTTNVDGTGTKALQKGDNEFSIITTSQSGDVETYKINIIREKDDNNNLASLKVLIDDNDTPYTPVFDKDELEYSLTTAIGASEVEFELTLESLDASYRLLDNNVLRVGNNLKRIVVTAEDGSTKTYSITITRPASDDNYLKDLIVYNDIKNDFLVGFDKDEPNYEITVTNDVTWVNVLGTKNDKLATVTGNGKYSLKVGLNEIPIKVTSESGVDRYYYVKITREPNSNPYLKSITTSVGTLSPDFDKEHLPYTINVDADTESINIVGIPEVSTTNVTGNNNYPLSVGNNEITLVTLAEDGISTLTYTITVTRDRSNNANLSKLLVKEGSLSPVFNKNTLNYEVKVTYNITSVHVLYEKEKESSIVTIIGGDSLVVGDNEVIVKVKAEDNTEKEYKINVIRQDVESISSALIDLEVSEGTLTPVFDKDTLYYEVELPYETSEIWVDAEAEAESSTVTGLGRYNLKTGDNLILVRVTNVENITRDYQVLVKRAKNNEARLSNVVIKDINIDFDKEITNYSVTTKANKLDFTSIVPMDPNATYEVTGNNFEDVGTYIVKIKVTAENGIDYKEYEFTVTREESNNAKLSYLEVEGYTLDPEFNPNTSVYDLTTEVENSVNSVNIIAKTEDKNATILGDGIRELVVGNNSLKVIVTSEDGTPKEYIINIIKKGSDNNRINILEVLNGTMSQEYNNETSVYNVTIPYSEDHLDLNIVLEDLTASYVVSGNENLPVGNSTVRVTVTSESGQTKVITLNVTREEAISALLKKLSVKDYDILPTFDMNTFRYNVVVDYEISELDIEAVPLDRLGTYEIIGNHDFTVGNNEVKINVTSRDGLLHETYYLNVIKQAYVNNFLKSLTTSEGDLIPEFNKYILTYSLDVASDVETITLIGEAEDPTSTVTGFGIKNLEEGENKFVVSVVNGGIRRNYNVIINKDATYSNYLESLVVKVGDTVYEISPEFDRKTNSYSVSVPASTETVTLIGTVSEQASVTGLGNQPIILGNNQITIKVTSKSGKERTYTLNVYRPVSTNAGVLNIIPSSGTLSPVFDEEVPEYNLSVGSNVENLSFTVNKSDKFATVSGNESKSVPVGDSQRTITITAEDGVTKKNYIININRARTDNALLSNLYVEGYSFDETFDPNLFEYHLTVPNAKTTLNPSEVIAISSDPYAKTTKQASIVLSTKTIGEYIVTVKSYDDSVTKEYKIYVTREKSNLTQLDSLSVDRGIFTPVFTPGTRTYNVYVYQDETEINVSAEVSNNDIEIISGVGNVSITEDNQEHRVLLKAENGDTGYYTINIHRSILIDEGLNDLGLNYDEELDHLDTEFVLRPTFNTDTLSYDITVPYEYKILDVMYETMNNQQTVKIKVGDEYVTDYPLVVGKNKVYVEVYDGLNKLTRTYVMNVERAKSRNTYLKQLEIVGYELNPEFEKTTQEYYIRVPVSVTDLDLEDIIAIPEEETSRVSIRGYTYLMEGANELEIEVISQDRSTRTYIVHVIRGEDKLSDLKNITVSTGVFWPLAPKFKSNVYDYTVTLPGIYDKATVEAVVDDSDLVDIEGIGEYPLVVGNNKVTLTSTSKVTGQISVYTINIVKEANEDVDLEYLSAREGTLDPTFDRATTKYRMSVPNDVDKLTLTYRTSAKTAKVFIAGNENFVSGENKVTIIVTNYEGTKTKAYQIIVTKDKNANPKLSGIRVYENYLEDDVLKERDYPISPEFDIEEKVYNVEVPETVDKVIVEATPVKVTTTVNGTGETYLNYGNNSVKISTKAENGIEDEYYINIYRNYNLDLESITLSDGQLNPEFRSDITEYTVNVDNDIKKISVVGAPVSDKVEVFGNDDYNLQTGENEIILTVKAPDNKTKTYKLTVNRAKNSNNYIRELQVNGIITPVFEKTIEIYDVDVRPDVTKLDLDIVLDAETSTYEILDNNLTAANNPNVVTIRVTAENGDTRDYKLNVMVRDWSFFSNRLRDLKVDHGQLTPDFNADINNYAVTVPNSVDVLGIEAIKQNSNQKVTINGINGATQFVNLQVGRNVIPITVTDQFDIDTSYYSLIVYRLEATDASLANLVVEGHQFYPYFNKTTYTYNLDIGSEVTDLNVIATPTDPNSKVEITGDKNIPSGKSEIRIKVTAPDNVHTRLYIINIDKSLSSNNYLTDIQVKDYTLNETFVKTKQGIYTLTVPSNVTNILVTGIPEVKTTTITGDGIVPLNKGKNIITIVATAENGDTRNYTLAVTRELSKDSSLADIILSDGDLDPVFNKDTLTYEVEVDEEIEEVTITGIPTDPNATVTGNGTYDLTKQEETEVSLVVTAEDGVSKTTYKVKFIREVNASAYLKSLVLKDGEIYPGFHKLITAYTILVPNEVRSLNMDYLTEDPDATSEVTGNASFKLGTNKVHIIVTSRDGKNTVDYEISVIRQSKGSNYLSDLNVTSADYSVTYPLEPVFDKKVLYYEVHVPEDVDTVSINAQVEDLTSTLRATDLGVKTLGYNTNRYYIQVESQGGVIRTYQVVIIKQTSENKLLTLESDKGTFNPKFDPDTNDYTLTVDNDVNEITLTGTATDGSTITGLGNVTLDSNSVTHTITVTKDSKDNVYTLTIIKGADKTNTNVNKLIPSSGTLSPAFTNDNDNYEISVDDSVSVISFEVETEDDKATVTGNELTSLEYGENNITITIKAADGETTRTINVKVTRSKKLQKINVEKTDIKLGIDEEYTIVYTLVPTGADNKEVDFISSDETIVSVSNSGVIKGLKIGTTTVKVVSRNDSNIYKMITVRVLNKKISSSNYTIERFDEKANDDPDNYEGNKMDYIIGAEPETTVEDFINSCDNDPATLFIYDLEGNKIEDKSEVVGTGMVIKLIIDDEVLDSLTISVRGDLDGDGIVAMPDYAALKNFLLGLNAFDYAKYKAADLDLDGIIAMPDYTKMKSFLLGDITSLNE